MLVCVYVGVDLRVREDHDWHRRLGSVTAAA